MIASSLGHALTQAPQKMQKPLLMAMFRSISPFISFAGTGEGRSSALQGQTSTQVEQPPGHFSGMISISPSKIFSTVIASVGQDVTHQVQVQQSSCWISTLPGSFLLMTSRSRVIASSGQASTQILHPSQVLSSHRTSPSILPVSGFAGLRTTVMLGQSSPQMPQTLHFSVSTLNVVLVSSADWRGLPASSPPSNAGTSRAMASLGQTSSQIVHRSHFSSSITVTMSYVGNPSFSRIGSRSSPSILSVIALKGHMMTQTPQYEHFSGLTSTGSA